MPKSSFKAGYLAFSETLGQHIRKRRMDLGLLQRNVDEIVDTSIDCITFWENGKIQPQIHFFPKIIFFLGHYPFEEVNTFSGKLIKYRHHHGLTYKELGKWIGVDGTTITSWESRKTIPNESIRKYVLDCIR